MAKRSALAGLVGTDLEQSAPVEIAPPAEPEPPQEPHAVWAPPVDPLEPISRWFQGLQRHEHEQTSAFAVLLVAAIVARSKQDGRVTTTDLMALLPRAAVEDGLRRLQARGFLRVHDLGTFVVAKTPVELPPL